MKKKTTKPTKTAAKSKGALLGNFIKAKEKGMEVTIKNAPGLIDKTQDKEDSETLVKVSMDIKAATDAKIKNAMYWGRMDSRAEVVEEALYEYFKNHPDLIKPAPPKK